MPLFSVPKPPVVREVQLRKLYSFQYENFLLATQGDHYLLLEKSNTSVWALKFTGSISVKYGSPNDEARGGHPLAKFGLGFYGLFSVDNSPWISEFMTANRAHPRHSDAMFASYQHYVACFKDVMLEVVCRGFEEVELEEQTLTSILQEQLSFLECIAPKSQH